MTDKQPEALRLAEQMEDGRWQGMNDLLAATELRRLHEENEALRAALAQPEPEPVAWMHPEWNTYTRAPAMSITPKEDWTPLYTAPPQREWQGLTDEEIAHAVKSADAPEMVTEEEFLFIACRATEAALKEKNA